MSGASKKALEFAAYTGTGVEKWMRWHGWKFWVGCDHCTNGGSEASCWGRAGCHGYLNGCGCKDCVERDLKESESVNEAG